MATFFRQLRDLLSRGPVALATVVDASGSTPRIAGARMAVGADGDFTGTVGGGLTEGRILELAATTLADGTPRQLDADLRGNPDEIRDGICGGTMTLWITRLTAGRDSPAIHQIVSALEEGKTVSLGTFFDAETPLVLDPTDPTAFVETLTRAPRLLVVGGGHIGRCLAELARTVGFDVIVQDDRPEWLEPSAFPTDCRLVSTLAEAKDRLSSWEGGRYTALVTRGFFQDVAALQVLATIHDLTYVGLLGSRKRIHTVLAAAPKSPFPDGVLHAPVGLEIAAETPEEIAVSIVGEMIGVRRKSHRP